jgi:hypothetical protein
MAQNVPPAHGSDRGVSRDPQGAEGVAGEFGPGSGARPGWTGAGPGRAGGRGPFAYQHGNRLLLLEARPGGWVLAELRFDPSTCRYAEVRRVRYRWAREATGALISRALAEGDAIAERTDRDLQAWLLAE